MTDLVVVPQPGDPLARLLPATPDEITRWLSLHGLSATAGVGVILAAVRRDLTGVCSACRPGTTGRATSNDPAHQQPVTNQ